MDGIDKGTDKGKGNDQGQQQQLYQLIVIHRATFFQSILYQIIVP